MRTIEPVYIKLGEMFYNARLKKGLTTYEASQALLKYGISLQRTSWTHIECGKQRVMIHSLPAFCKALDLDANEVFKLIMDI